MTHILDILRERREEQKIEEQASQSNQALRAAKNAYDEMRVSLLAIKTTKGFAEIVNYWTRVKEAAENVMQSRGSDPSSRDEALIEWRTAKQFLLFLNNIGSK